jgi:parvulin-like peptidyl-prolyl isomerase
MNTQHQSVDRPRFVPVTGPGTARRRAWQIVMPVIAMLAMIASGTPAVAQTDTMPAPVVLAVINGDTILSTDLDAEIVRLHTRLTPEQKAGFNYRTLLDRLINDRLLIQEARAMGMDTEPSLVEMLEENRRGDAIRLYVREKFVPDLTITDADILACFIQNYARMQIRTVSVTKEEQARQLADAVRAGASMDSIARAESVDSYRYKGGLHSFKYLDDTESIFRTHAQSLAVGQVSQPFPYRQAFAFLRVEQTAPADTAELPKIQAEITSVLTAEKRTAAWQAFTDSLTAIYPPRIDSLLLAEVYGDSAKLYTPDFAVGTDRIIIAVDTAQVCRDAQLRTLISRAVMEAGNKPFTAIVDTALKIAGEELILGAASVHDGYYDRETVARLSRRSLDSALVEVYIKENVIPKITFNRAEFQQYYDDHVDEFREPEKYQLDRIEVKEDSVAQQIVRRLQDGADFEFVAREFHAATAKGEEKTAWMSLAAFPETVAREIAELSIGAFSRPFPTVDGWVILMVRGKQPGRLQSLDEVEMDIRRVMFQREFNRHLDETFALLKANADIRINQQAVEAYFGEEK